MDVILATYSALRLVRGLTLVPITVNTGLLTDDVFYFGNAVGESGDSTSNALVIASKFTAPAKPDASILPQAIRMF